jgi:Mlc titration factor MtfA (ptsG expression regulator)
VRLFRRAPAIELPAGWEDIAADGLAWWPLLDGDERERLGELMAALVEDKRWEAAAGFELTDEIRVVIAAGAARLILGLDLDWYRNVGTIIVHPSTLHFNEPRPGPAGTFGDPVPLVGQARHRGPVLIAWDAARRNARHPRWGEDVVLHEFAHKLDMLDDDTDGIPPIADRGARARFVAVSTREFEQVRLGLGGGLLRSYAAENQGEFFAVATEAFFSRPTELAGAHPELYGVLKEFYRQDPASRAWRQNPLSQA